MGSPSLTHPGDTWNYEYDEAGRYTTFSTNLGDTTVDYYSNGWMKERYLPNGSSAEYEYNEVGLVSNLQNKNSLDAQHSIFQPISFDGVFNMTEVGTYVDSVSDMTGTIEFEYDTKDRLTLEDSDRYGGYTEGQVYDGAGNPTTFKNNSGRTYNNSNQRSNGGFTLDGNGNPTTYAGVTNTYDRENRLTSFDSGDLTAGYRPDNLRAWRDDTNGEKFFLYDNGSVICELDDNGDVIASNAFAPDGLVSRTEGEVSMQYLFDLQGNVSTILKSNEEVSIHFAYNAWGSRNFTYPDPGELKYTVEQPFSYNGRWGYYFDSETSLYYCQNRYYDPEQGRWLTRDPIGFAGGINKYGYCGDSPITNIDPLGLAVFLCFEAVDDGQGGPGSWAGKAGAKHWYVMAGCDRSSGWAPTGSSSKGGDLTQGHFMPDGVSVLYGKPGRPDSRCIMLPATKEQEECICEALRNFHNARAGGNAPPTLGGQKWEPNGQAGGYRFGYHNCQDFSKTLLERCGISVPVATQTSWITPLVERTPLGPVGKALPF